MFREMIRKNQQLSTQECMDILKNEPRGVLSVLGDDGYPYGVPMNFWYCEKDQVIYFHSSKIGHKVDAVHQNNKVSFCVYDQGYRIDGEWALNVKSVIVFGRITLVEGLQETIDVCRNLSYKYTNDTEYIENEIEKFSSHVLCFKLEMEHMTGKLVNES